MTSTRTPCTAYCRQAAGAGQAAGCRHVRAAMHRRCARRLRHGAPGAAVHTLPPLLWLLLGATKRGHSPARLARSCARPPPRQDSAELPADAHTPQPARSRLLALQHGKGRGGVAQTHGGHAQGVELWAEARQASEDVAVGRPARRSRRRRRGFNCLCWRGATPAPRAAHGWHCRRWPGLGWVLPGPPRGDLLRLSGVVQGAHRLPPPAERLDGRRLHPGGRAPAASELQQARASAARSRPAPLLRCDMAAAAPAACAREHAQAGVWGSGRRAQPHFAANHSTHSRDGQSGQMADFPGGPGP